MISGGLPLGLDQHGHIQEVLAIPGQPRLQQLQPLTVRSHRQRDIAAILGRRDIRGVTFVKVLSRHFWSRLGRLQLEGLAISAGDGISQGIERQLASQRQGRHNLGTAYKIHGCRLAVVAHGEVAVVRSDNGVCHADHLLRAAPLPNAWAAGIRQYRRVNLLEQGHLAIALDGGAHLLRAWGHHKGHRRVHAVSMRLLCHVRGATHVLVGGIGAAPNKGRRDLIDKLILGIFHLGS